MIKQFIPSSVCLKCQGCCRFAEENSVWSVKLLEGERLRLKCANKTIPLKYSEKEGNFYCSFLDKSNNKCQVYSNRPLECQLYPFLIHGKNKKASLAVDLNCPFVQKELKSKKIKDFALELASLLKTPAYQDILKNNPHIIQEYTNVLILEELNA